MELAPASHTLAQPPLTVEFQEHVSLAPLTSFRIGGPARLLCRARTIADLQEAFHRAQAASLPVFILGEGSNILVSDEGFHGLVIKMEFSGRVFERVESGVVRVAVSAGEHWDDVVTDAVSRNLYGIENLSGIPGTAGAVPVQNVGAYGVEAKDVIEWVEVFDPASNDVRKLSKAECAFSYRDSIFKHGNGRSLVITRVSFLLTTQGTLGMEYPDVKHYFSSRSGTPALRGMREAILEIRKKKFPALSEVGTAGSFFKNIVLPRSQAAEVLLKFPDAPSFSLPDGRVKIPTAWLLDRVGGWRGVRRGNVGVFSNQALVLVNWGGGTAHEVHALADEISQDMKKRIGISLTPEVTFV